jgi:CelD/BcsL family acetyltransferase involved in cellulose biosynthesis
LFPCIAVLSCEVTTFAELGAPERERWEEIRRGEPALSSPFFSFDFAAAVAAVRRDVRVGVLRGSGGGVAGFFPFQFSRTGVGRPVGGKLSDYHGVIVGPEVEWDACEVLRRCGLRSFAFSHLIGSQRPFRPYFKALAASPVVVLDDPAGPAPRPPGQAERKRRRLERRATLRLDAEGSPDALHTLLVWKSSQYRRTGAFDTLSRPWVVELLERLHATKTSALEGALSCLWADDVLIAAHLGLRSGRVLHWWFPGYDAALARDSPGLVHLSLLLGAAPEDGIGLVDFGKGDEAYKGWFANGSVELGIGSVETSRLAALRAGAARVAWRRALHSPLHHVADARRKRLDFR